MRALFDNRKKDTSGQLLTMGRSGSSISNTLCQGPDKNGWAENSDRMPYVEYAESAVPSSRRMNQGLAFTQDGALYITGDAVTSTSNKVNGIAIRADGALHVAPAGSTATLKSNGMGITASGQVIMAESFVLPLNTSVVPLIGTGSATYTRATVATVFDNESVLRNVLSGEARFQGARRVRNFVVASEDLMNAIWSAVGTGVKVSATEFSFPAINGGVAHSFTAAVGDVVSFSVTLSGSGTITLVSANFGADLQVTLTATPQRFVASGVATATSLGAYVYRRPADTATSATIKYMQFENVTGQSNQAPGEYVSVGVLSTPFHGAGVDGVKYFSTTKGNSVASNVVTESAGSPISASTLLGYLAEGARTNLLLQSNEFETAPWVTSATNVKDVVGPDGATSAWTCPGNGTQTVTQDVVLTAANHTATFFIKKTTGVSGSFPVIRAFASPLTSLCTVDTNNGTATAWTALTGGWTIQTTSVAVSSFGDFWRVSLTFLATAATWTVAFYPAGATTATQSTGSVGGGTLSAVFFGGQTELGSFASTYIPTTTASVVRNADVLTYPSAGNCDVVKGTAYCEASVASIFDNESPFSIDDASSNNRVEHRREASATLVVSSGGVNYAVIGAAGLAANTMQKSAVTWNTNYANVVLNGVASTADTSVTVPASFTTINIGTANSGTLPMFGTIRNVRIYSAQLSAAQLSAVTV